MDEELQKRIDKALTKTSASAIQEFVNCPRRWWQGYVMGARQPATAAMQRGTDIHALVEHYFEKGVVPESPYKKIVDSALVHLPKPGEPGLEVEKWIEVPTFEGGPVIRGRYDFILWQRAVPLVGDTKTTSDFRYVKTPAQLATNIQLNIYGTHVLAEAPECESVDLMHVYMRTRGAAKTVPSAARVSREQVETVFASTVETIKEMVALVRAMPASIDDITPNTASCDMYGGCFYRPQCQGMGALASAFDEPLVQIRRNDEMSEANGTNNNPPATGNTLMDRLNRSRAEAEAKKPALTTQEPAAPPAVAQPNPPSVAAVPVAPPVQKSHECTNGWVKSTDASAPPGAFMPCPVCRTGGGAQKVEAAAPAPERVNREFIGSVGILPPDAPARTNQPGDEPQPAKKTRAKKEKPAPVEATPAPVAPKITVEGDDGVMRPLESTAKMEKILAPVAAIPSPEAADKALEPPKAPALGRKPLAIYIKTIPTKGPHAGKGVLLEDWLAPLERKVEKEHKDDKGNPKPAVDWQVIEYKNGKGELAACIRDNIKSLPEVVLIHNPYSDHSQVFLHAVTPFATEIAMGV